MFTSWNRLLYYDYNIVSWNIALSSNIIISTILLNYYKLAILWTSNSYYLWTIILCMWLWILYIIAEHIITFDITCSLRGKYCILRHFVLRVWNYHYTKLKTYCLLDECLKLNKKSTKNCQFCLLLRARAYALVLVVYHIL